MVDFSNRAGDIVEPAGALAAASVAGNVIPHLKGQVVAIVSGRCFTLDQMPSVVDRAEKFSGRKITFIVQLPERPRALEMFLSKMPAQVNMTNIVHPPKT